MVETFSPARVGRLLKKELSEILRDRRTILTLIGMPLLLYPLISVVFQQFLLESKVSATHGTEYRLGFTDERVAEVMEWMLNFGQSELERTESEKIGRPRWKLFLTTDDTGKKDLTDGTIDLLVLIPDPEKLPPVRELGVLRKDFRVVTKFVFDSQSTTSQSALVQVERRLNAIQRLALSTRLDLPRQLPHPRMLFLETQREAVESTEAKGGVVSLSALVPLILILMTITGAVYPAIDLTAGERERGTLEMLMAAPVSRFELLGGKYIAVVAVAMLTALVNLVSMFITLRLSGMDELLLEGQPITFALIAALFGLMLLFSCFFSAVLLTLTSFARSFKEAQAYLIPLMLASLAPGVAALIPGIELQGLFTVAPLLNIVLLARDSFSGTADVGTLMVVVATTLLYAAIALSFATRVFGAENVLYNEQSGWTDLFRRPDEPQSEASLSSALVCLACIVPVHLALVGAVRAALPLIEDYQGFALTILNLIEFGLLPGIFLAVGRVRIASGLALRKFTVGSCMAAIILGVCLWPTVFWLSSWQPILNEQILRAASSLRNARWDYVAMVVSAAILEELFFRGFLFQSLRRSMSGPGVVATTAILFGLLHVFVGGFARMIPSTFLGFVLGFVRLKSDSVWPGVILHLLHNILLVWLIQAESFHQDSVPPLWIAGSVIGTVLGIGMLWLPTVSPKPPEPASANGKS